MYVPIGQPAGVEISNGDSASIGHLVITRHTVSTFTKTRSSYTRKPRRVNGNLLSIEKGNSWWCPSPRHPWYWWWPRVGTSAPTRACLKSPCFPSACNQSSYISWPLPLIIIIFVLFCIKPLHRRLKTAPKLTALEKNLSVCLRFSTAISGTQESMITWYGRQIQLGDLLQYYQHLSVWVHVKSCWLSCFIDVECSNSIKLVECKDDLAQ